MDKLDQAQIDDRLTSVPDWSQLTDTIGRTYQFRDFRESMQFVNAIADYAETAQHHPDLLIRWNKVTLTLSTHDAGGITQKDFEFAAKADEIAREHGGERARAAATTRS